MLKTRWIDWVERLQAIAHNGLTYTENHFDVERYEKIRQLAVEMAAAHSDDDPQVIQGLFGQEKGYITPKVDVRGVVFKDNTILLVQEKVDGLWSLPGGWADIGDTPSEAAVREIREESGYEARAVKLLAAYDRSRHGHAPFPFYTYKLFFLCNLVGGEARISDETTGVGFFAEDVLPPLSTTRVTMSELARFFEHHRHPDLPTDFD